MVIALLAYLRRRPTALVAPQPKTKRLVDDRLFALTDDDGRFLIAE